MKYLHYLGMALWIPGMLVALLGRFGVLSQDIGRIGKVVAVVGALFHFIPVFARMADVEPDPRPPGPAPGVDAEIPKK